MQQIKGDGVLDASARAPTGGVDALDAVVAPVCTPHTVPDIQSPEKNMGVGVSKSSDQVLDFDKE